MTKHKYRSLADRLKRSGETQEQFAALAKTSQASVSLALNYGKGSFRNLKRMADAGDFPIESFAKVAA